jgi:hypothetical protein
MNPLLGQVLRRLPILLREDPELAWKAAPFIQDPEEAKRLLEAYRSGNLYKTIPPGWKPALASLPISLNLGVIGEEEAIQELFAPPPDGEAVLDKGVLEAVWAFLRDRKGRELFTGNLDLFSGLVRVDTERDGISETQGWYQKGVIQEYFYDGDQDGIADCWILFEEGEAKEALARVLPERKIPPAPEDSEGKTGRQGRLFSPREQPAALVRYEGYPAVLSIQEGELRYLFRPRDFFFTPVRLEPLLGSGLLFPQGEPQALSRRALVNQALLVEKPSREFPGAREILDMDRGIPLRAREVAGNRLVSETVFENGRPLYQAVDLDLDGRLETVRRFRWSFPGVPGDGGLEPFEWEFDYADSDWDGDGVMEVRQY